MTLKVWVIALIGKPEDVPLRRRSSRPTSEASAGAHQELTVINLNLWHDWPRHRRLPERLEMVASLVEEQGAQVVLLQESLRTREMEAHSILADRLGMQAVYHRANGSLDNIGFEEGLAVLTSLPLGEIRIKTLQPSSEPFVRRVALGAEIKTSCASFWVFSTHLSLLRNRNAAQLETLRKWIAQITVDKAALIGGDFNADESSGQIQKISTHWIDTFRSLHPHGNGHSHALRWPWGSTLRNHRLDYLFFKPAQQHWEILEAGYLDHTIAPYSDHKAVLTRLAPCPTI